MKIIMLIRYMSLFLINGLFFIFITIIVKKMSLGSESIVPVMTLYIYLFRIFENKIEYIKNLIYLIFNIISTIIYFIVMCYLKKLYMFGIFDIQTIIIIFFYIFIPLIQYYGVINKIIEKKI